MAGIKKVGKACVDSFEIGLALETQLLHLVMCQTKMPTDIVPVCGFAGQVVPAPQRASRIQWSMALKRESLFRFEDGRRECTQVVYGHRADRTGVCVSFVRFHRVSRDAATTGHLVLLETEFKFVLTSLMHALKYPRSYYARETIGPRVVTVRKKHVLLPKKALSTMFTIETEVRGRVQSRDLTKFGAHYIIRELMMASSLTRMVRSGNTTSLFETYYGLRLMQRVEPDSREWSSVFNTHGALETKLASLFNTKLSVVTADALAVRMAFNVTQSRMTDRLNVVEAARIIRTVIQGCKITPLQAQLFHHLSRA